VAAKSCLPRITLLHLKFYSIPVVCKSFTYKKKWNKFKWLCTSSLGTWSGYEVLRLILPESSTPISTCFSGCDTCTTFTLRQSALIYRCFVNYCRTFCGTAMKSQPSIFDEWRGKLMASEIFRGSWSYRPHWNKMNVLLAHDSCPIFAVINYDSVYLQHKTLMSMLPVKCAPRTGA